MYTYKQNTEHLVMYVVHFFQSPPKSSSNLLMTQLVIGLITDNDEMAYREEVRTLTKWCQEEPPLTQHRQDQGAGGELQETEQRTHTHLPSTRHLWSGLAALSSSAFTSPRISHGLLTQIQCWRRHISVSSSWDGWGSLERAPESSDPSTPALWRASWPAAITAWFGNSTAGNRRASAKGRANCPPHCWRWASLPPGHLHQAVYKESPEDYQRLQPPVPQTALSVALRKTSPQHPIAH